MSRHGGRAAVTAAVRSAILACALASALLAALPRPASGEAEALAAEQTETATGAVAFRFLPPAPTRNFQPIQLIFLNLPFESAITMPAGGLAVELQTAEINVVSTANGALDATLDFESNRTVFGARYGLFDDWEIGLELPFISRYGGFLDPFIDAVESFFGAENPDRKLFPDNSYGGFIVKRAGTVLFQGSNVTFQPGDLAFFLKHQLTLPPGWPRLALRGAIKAPTGNPDQVLGSGEPDFGAGLAVDWQPCQRLMLYGNAALVYPLGPITDGDLTLNPFVTQSFAAHFGVTERWSAMLHQATYTSPFHGTGSALLEATAIELGLGLNFAYSDALGVQLLAIDNVSGVAQAADFTLLLALRWRSR